jgi:LIVCS family branched-chain amino acid:cation transporter
MKTVDIISLGIALFAMFFGAGNVIFPLDLGRILGDHVIFGIFGLFLSAVLMPLIGVFAGVLYQGDYRSFFGRLGKIPGELMTLACMVTIGIFGAIPRILTVAHAALAWYLPFIPLWAFTIVAGLVILLAILQENNVVTVIGKFLGPIKIVLLTGIIIAGFLVPGSLEQTAFTSGQALWNGFIEGYSTLDLLGAIFFAKLIMVGVKHQHGVSRKLLIDLCKAGGVGAFLLGTMYVGFMYTSAMHGYEVAFVSRKHLMFALGDLLLGRLGLLLGITIVLATLTTAIALSAVFADYLSTDLLKKKISYRTAAILSVAVACAFANLGFEGIMNYIEPMAFICYPAMIVLSLVNIAHKLFGFKPVKTPVFATLIGTFAFAWHFNWFF